MASTENFLQLVLLNGSIEPTEFRRLIVEQARNAIEQYAKTVDPEVQLKLTVNKIFYRRPRDWAVGSVEYPVL